MKPLGEIVSVPLKNQISLSQREKQLNVLFTYPAIREFVRAHPEIPRYQYLRSLGQLNEFVLEHERCRRCPGLDQCPNRMKGHTPELVEFASYFDVAMQPCDKLKAVTEQQKRSTLIRSHHIPRDILESSFATIEADPARIDVLEVAIDFCTKFAEDRPETGLYLYGSFGVGKSRIAGAIVNELVKYDVDSYMVYVPEFIREVFESIGDKSSIQQKMNALKKASLLVLDDIGAESVSPWIRDDVIGAILHYRAAERLPTIFTSNFDLDELEEHLAYSQKGQLERTKAKRIMERIRHYVRPILVRGVNRRVSR
ncbi:primosomal protein DnaI [Hazenella coriacea]|uniref:Replicative DNA helicase loader DnaI n=1 Tax=Hazenella coriacea TaxID=1179467 RepID=A0A4R3LGS8_9BACL|nr:primosomal protein DnaI [Hazenella coriacea]TCS96716.1 replicative DNA helicase loader DnaI [Hazenella coriacea]